MPDLARSNPRAGSDKPKVLLVRQPVKSVRPSDQPSKAAFRLSFAALCAVASVALTWLIGHLGFRLGYAPAVHVPELLAEPGEGLATGAMIVMEAPMNVFDAGLDQWPWLMAWFFVIAMPAASMAAVRPYPAGGPRPSVAAATFNIIGSTVAGVIAAAIFAWVVSPWRLQWLRPMPMLVEEVGEWHAGATAAAGLDTLAVVASILWLVLSARLKVPAWLRVLSVTTCAFALAAAVVGFSISSAIAVHGGSAKSLCFLDGEGPAGPQLMLGYTREHAAMVAIVDETPQVTLISRPSQMVIIEQISLVEWANEAVRAEP
jgi:hypothetical protein